ncbi:hypothetical protein ACIQMR_33390 [Streptomyces sp. NPDC091376]|uniref:hypothetical protein n=1 Tax=Streptomyces sp. NPDC091376 TaxID=3365994 RepID=UPI003810F3CA
MEINQPAANFWYSIASGVNYREWSDHDLKHAFFLDGTATPFHVARTKCSRYEDLRPWVTTYYRILGDLCDDLCANGRWEIGRLIAQRIDWDLGWNAEADDHGKTWPPSIMDHRHLATTQRTELLANLSLEIVITNTDTGTESHYAPILEVCEHLFTTGDTHAALLAEHLRAHALNQALGDPIPADLSDLYAFQAHHVALEPYGTNGLPTLTYDWTHVADRYNTLVQAINVYVTATLLKLDVNIPTHPHDEESLIDSDTGESLIDSSTEHP